MKVSKHTRLNIEHDRHVIQWTSDEPTKVWLDLKEPGMEDGPYKNRRTVLRLTDLTSIVELIEKAKNEIAEASPKRSDAR